MNVLGQAPAKLIVGNTADTRQMSGEVGVISFAWAPPDGENKFRETMFGGFALPVHDGRLAIEIAKRKNGPAPEGDFTGSYDAKTYFGATPDPKKLFSNGTITINEFVPQGGEFAGVYKFEWALIPVAPWPAVIGLVDNTTLNYHAIGVDPNYSVWQKSDAFYESILKSLEYQKNVVLIAAFELLGKENFKHVLKAQVGQLLVVSWSNQTFTRHWTGPIPYGSGELDYSAFDYQVDFKPKPPTP